MKKILDNFKKMTLLMKIASIAFLAAFIMILSSTLIGYIGNIFVYGVFSYMFSNVYNFFAEILYFVTSLLQILYIAALVTAMFSGNKKNVAFVLACKATLMLFNLTLITPFMRVLRVIGYGFKNGGSVTGADIGNLFMSVLSIAVMGALAILLMGGFGKLTKLLGIIIAGAYGIFIIIDFADLIRSFADCIKYFINGNVRDGIMTILVNSGNYCGSLILICGYIVLSLSVVFATKGAIIPKKAPAQQ